MTREPLSVAVVGAGWSGLAAAVALAEAGRRVTLLDTAHQPGGRARGIVLRLAQRELALDNGQHLLVGAYRHCLALSQRVGAPADALDRRPMTLASVDGLVLAPPAWPAPWHLLAGLLRAAGLSVRERVSLVRLMAGLQWRGWQPPKGVDTVARWMAVSRQPEALRARFWEPLCVATLNTDPAQACATTFATVLRDTLGAQRSATDFITARRTLDDILPAPALAWLRAAGADCRLGVRVRACRPDIDGTGWVLDCTDGPLRAEAVVLAVPPQVQHELLEPIAPPQAREAIAALARLASEPIATAYLAWPARPVPSVPQALLLTEAPTQAEYGQWFFDRGEQAGLRVGAVVVSARGRRDVDNPALLAGIVGQVVRQLGTPMPLDARLVVERRATIRCSPDRPRVRADRIDDRPLPWRTLVLAGDHAWPQYPATLEAAVLSGQAAAQTLTRR